MGRTACTEPQCLYKGALYLFPSVRNLRTRHTVVAEVNVKFLSPARHMLRFRSVAHETTVCRNPQIHNFTQNLTTSSGFFFFFLWTHFRMCVMQLYSNFHASGKPVQIFRAHLCCVRSCLSRQRHYLSTRY